MAARAVDREFVHIVGLAMASQPLQGGPSERSQGPSETPRAPTGPFLVPAWARDGNSRVQRGVRGPILTTVSAKSTILEHAWNNSPDPADPPDPPETVSSTAGRTLPTTRAGGQDDGS